MVDRWTVRTRMQRIARTCVIAAWVLVTPHVVEGACPLEADFSLAESFLEATGGPVPESTSTSDDSLIFQTTELPVLLLRVSAEPSNSDELTASNAALDTSPARLELAQTLRVDVFSNLEQPRVFIGNNKIADGALKIDLYVAEPNVPADDTKSKVDDLNNLESELEDALKTVLSTKCEVASSNWDVDVTEEVVSVSRPLGTYILLWAMLGPTFLLFVGLMVSNRIQAKAKYESNERYRRKKKLSAGAARVRFDMGGRALPETLAKLARLDKLEGIMDNLLGFAKKGDEKAKEALAAAQNVHAAVAGDGAGDSIGSHFDETDHALKNHGEIPAGFAGVLHKLKGEKPPKLLEPNEQIKGVHFKRKGWLAVDARFHDKYSLGNRRVLLAVIVFLVSVGPLRFMGVTSPAAPEAADFLVTLPPMLIVATVVIIAVVLTILHVRGDTRQYGFRAAIKLNLSRLVPVMSVSFAAGLLLVCGTAFFLLPLSNDDLNNKPLFLPVPPQYRVEEVPGQNRYLATIFGIMHGNLACLCVLPLPICYFFHSFLVTHFPVLRHIVPGGPVNLHRNLGYALLGGLSTTAFIWMIFQGNNCFHSDTRILETESKTPGVLIHTPRGCLAFEPGDQAGRDVFCLRFEMVWPLSFFFIPLMIYGPNDKMYGCLAKQDPKPGEKPKEEGQGTWWARFTLQRIVDACFWSMTLSGMVIGAVREAEQRKLGIGSLNNNLVFVFGYGYIPFWLIILVFLVASSVARVATALRTWLYDAPEDMLGWYRFCQRVWWEWAYWCHAFAFTTAVAGALTIRLDVFWVALFPWGVYILDRIYGVWRASKSATHIIAHKALKASFVVNKDGKPSQVRLIVKRPPGFEYNAGQWCHIALRPCGHYCAVTKSCLPFYEWHPFSIASAPAADKDILEFHITVQGRWEELGEQWKYEDCTYKKREEPESLWVKNGPDGDMLLRRKSYPLDWICPYRVPHVAKKGQRSVRSFWPFGGKPRSEGPRSDSEAPRVDTQSEAPRDRGSLLEFLFGSQQKAKPSGGAFVELTDAKGKTTKIRRPHEQWTGRLWNLVSELKSAGSEGEEKQIRVMGPYGTLFSTCFTHSAVMLIGSGVGYPSMGGMLRQILEDNLALENDARRHVCFMWGCSKVDQLQLCFPGLLADLTRYVHRKSIADLQKWLTIKIFVDKVGKEDVLATEPDAHVSEQMVRAFKQVKEWLLGTKDAVDTGGAAYDEDGTYVAQGTLGGSFGTVLRNSIFVRDAVVGKGRKLGICFCGVKDLSDWLWNEIECTTLPTGVIEYASEVAGG